MAHEHKAPGPCIWCAIKHLGAAKVRIAEALASTDEGRRRTRLLDATFEMNEAETTHLSDHQEFSQQIRTLRKKVEEVAFGMSSFEPELQSQLNEIIEDLTKEQIRQGREALAEPIATITPEAVHAAIRHYEQEYKAPASVSDIQFVLAIPHGSPLDKEIDRALEKAPPELVRQTAEELLSQGVVKTTEFGGYVNPDAVERFNMARPTSNMKMALSTTKDVATVVGSSFVAKVAEKGIDQLDAQLGLSNKAPHERLGTYLAPIAGAAAVFYAWHRTRRGGGDGKELALAVAGSHLLAQTIDVAQEAYANPSGFVIRSYQPPAPAARTTSNRPLF